MKNRFLYLSAMISLFALLFFSAGITAKASGNVTGNFPLISDGSGILSGAEVYDLTNMAGNVTNKYSIGVYVIIVDDYYDYGYDAEDAAINIYNDYGLGVGGEALTLFLSMDDRDYNVQAFGNKAESAFNLDARDYLIDSFLDEFGDDNWYNGLSNYISAADYILDLYESGSPYQGTSGSFNIISVIIIIIAALIGALINISRLKKKLVSVELASTAMNYVEGSINMEVNTDRYLYTTTQVIVHQKSNSSGRASSSGKF